MLSQLSSNLLFLSRASAALVTSATLIAALAISTPPSHASDLLIKYDQSQILRLPRPVAEVIIGNPSIADITVQSKKMLIVTGKSFGITNIIALDADKNIIQDSRIVVQRDHARIINVHKGSKRESYNCSPQCNPTITVGDDSTYLNDIAKSSQLKLKISSDQAAGGPASE